MDTESVVEFLGNVPLLQRLPSTSLNEIAQFVVFKRYERGDYVVREGQDVDGLYILWEGEAQVLGPPGEENRPEFLLKRFDFFGHGIFGNVYTADVVAVSELTCLLLTSDRCALLTPHSVWDSDNEVEKGRLFERILYMEPLDFNIFRGTTLSDAPSFGKVYGGQLVGQALAAATKTVELVKIVHNLHSYFVRVGDVNFPIVYEVHRIRDGNNFATRRVDARQNGKIIFTLFASFQREQQGFIHQESTMPCVPAPETLLPGLEMRERRLTDPLLPKDYRNKKAADTIVPTPIDIRYCEPSYYTEQTKAPPRLRYWFRAKGKLLDDQALHRCVVAYASDLLFAWKALSGESLTLTELSLPTTGLPIYLALYFSEPQSLGRTQKRSFNIFLDQTQVCSVPIVPALGKASQVVLRDIVATSRSLILFQSTDDSTLPPIINGLELYSISNSREGGGGGGGGQNGGGTDDSQGSGEAKARANNAVGGEGKANGGKKKKNKLPLILGVTLASVFAILSSTFGALFMRKRRNAKPHSNTAPAMATGHGTGTGMSPLVVGQQFASDDTNNSYVDHNNHH